MLIPFDPNATWQYSLRADESEPKTVFILGYFDVEARAEIMEAMPSADGDLGGRVRFLVDVVRRGVRGWTNFAQPFDAERGYQHLRFEWIQELATEILSKNFTSGTVEKN
jgi:hypothetical protein